MAGCGCLLKAYILGCPETLCNALLSLNRDVLVTAMLFFFCSHKLMEKLHRMQMRAVSINGSAVYIIRTCSRHLYFIDLLLCRCSDLPDLWWRDYWSR